MRSPTANYPCFVCHDKKCKYRWHQPDLCMKEILEKKGGVK